MKNNISLKDKAKNELAMTSGAQRSLSHSEVI